MTARTIRKTTLGLCWLAGAALPAQAPSPAAVPALELRILAADDYAVGGVSFDPAAEAARLRAWLDDGRNRERVREDPARIAAFNALGSARGGSLSPYLKWYPRVIRPRVDAPRAWEHAYSATSPSVVALFDEDEYAAAPEDRDARLVELLPVNMHARSFSGRDLAADEVRAGVDPESGAGAVYYGVVASEREAFADWSERHRGSSCAIIVRGEIRSAPTFEARVAGSGMITGNFTRREADELALALKAGAVAGASNGGGPTVVTGQADGPLPTGTDPADLRAMQGAQAMLAAEKRLRDLIKAGKISGIDRILTFEEISSWPYEDGLLGMPKQLEKLDGKNVLMTGFMLPIDEVENIKEFLLVQSLWSCCFGQPPDINGIVRVVMKGDARIDYQFDPIKVVGVFEIEATFEDGYCVDIYQLHADSVEVIR